MAQLNTCSWWVKEWCQALLSNAYPLSQYNLDIPTETIVLSSASNVDVDAISGLIPDNAGELYRDAPILLLITVLTYY